MRPLKLTITGFGPYKDRTVIDMESLGRGGLYLVTGDTGAGKTFIFDALTFALYGEMSGGSRDSRSVRSQYADADTPTEAELVFEYRGRRYTVKRNPEYTRRRKRGDGYTTEGANAELHMPDGSVIDGASRVTAAVKDLLGIDRGQFCSIVMIAQGEFRRVLNASTDDRQLLFRKLFDTEPYNRLAEELKKKSRDINTSFDEKKKEIGMAFAGAVCRFDDGLSEELEAAKSKENGESAPDDMTSLLERIAERGSAVESNTKDRLEHTEDELAEAQKKAAVIEGIRENKSMLEAAVSERKTLSETADRAKAALDLASERKPEMERLRNELALLSGSMESYDRLDAIGRELSDAKAKAKDIGEKLASAETKKSGAKEKLEKIKEEAEDLKTAGETLLKIKGEIERIENRMRDLRNLAEDIRQASETGRELSKKQEELAPLLERADSLEADHSRASSAYLREQAGILASGLAQGEPCPVCGSTEHPAPAKLSAEAPSAQEVELIEKQAKEARQKAADVSAKAQTIKGNLEALLERARDAALRQTGTDDLERASGAAEKELTELGTRLGTLRKDESAAKERSDKAEEAAKQAAGAQKAYDEADEEASDLSRKAAAQSETVKGIEKRLEETAGGLAFGSRTEAQEHIKGLEAGIKSISDAITGASEEHTNAESRLKACSARIEELERMASGYDPEEEQSIKEIIKRAGDEKAELTQMLIDTSSDLRSVDSALAAIRSGVSRLEEIRREHETIDSLTKTAAGSLAGKDRITLEAFVQTMYFDRVLRRANVRLSMISDGQYEFVRGTESKDKRSHNGLDLAVVDHYSGAERPVSTLSGGESFMASLSLALGLSDEVQSSAGGIRLDTMFVDEGFGSLDSETLEKAIRTLTELSDEDKLVGIISHVDALKTRIDKQIIVTKTRGNGSRAEIRQ